MPRGIKTCKNCGKGHGPRVKMCDCGYDFAPVKPVAPVSRPNKVVAVKTEEPIEDGANNAKLGMGHILVPAGKCPYQFKEESEVPDWILKVREFGRNKGLTYAPEALVYWAGTFLNKFKPEDKKLIDKIPILVNM